MPFHTTRNGGGDSCGGYRLRYGKQGGRWLGLRMPFEASPMPFEIRDEGNYHSARLFGVLDGADLNAMTTEVERLEDAGGVSDRVRGIAARGAGEGRWGASRPDHGSHVARSGRCRFRRSLRRGATPGRT